MTMETLGYCAVTFLACVGGVCVLFGVACVIVTVMEWMGRDK